MAPGAKLVHARQALTGLCRCAAKTSFGAITFDERA